MCGITGFYSPDHPIKTTNYYESHLLIRHRGPDDEGFVSLDDGKFNTYKGCDTIESFQNFPHIESLYSTNLILGHRRLSIIDLSSRGHQPIFDDNGDYAIVYNGEVFNYIELRNELKSIGYKFNSDTDSEVVLKSYIQWGTDSFNKFNGMWAFAIFDRTNQTVILCRDRFGIKPLYYTIIDNILYFASEIKFLKNFINQELTINSKAVQNYLQYSLVNNSQNTIWDEIKEVLPSNYLTFSSSKLLVKSYWKLNQKSIDYQPFEALNKFEHLFENSIRLRMRSDVEVGSLLSGGLDSTSIVSALKRLGYLKNTNFKSFSAVFDEKKFSEENYINQSTKFLQINNYFIYPSADDVMESLPKLIYYIEEPFRSLSVLSQFKLYEFIASNSKVKVVLNGQGADELFGGYSIHYYYYYVDLLKRLQLLKFIKDLQKFRKSRNIDLESVIKNLILAFIKSAPYKNSLNTRLANEVKRSALREYLKYDDRNSMAHSIEVRVPYLDYRLVEFAFSLKNKFKIDNFVNKKLLRTYAKNKIPDSILNREDKMGFVSPQELWQKKELKSEFDKVFLEIKRNGLLNLMNTSEFYIKYRKYQQGDFTKWSYIWRIFCLYKWAETWGV